MKKEDLETILKQMIKEGYLEESILDEIKGVYEIPPELEENIFRIQKKLDSLDVELTNQRTVLAKESKEFTEMSGTHLQDAFNSPKADECMDKLYDESEALVNARNKIKILKEERLEVQKEQKQYLREKGELEAYAQAVGEHGDKMKATMAKIKKAEKEFSELRKSMRIKDDMLNAYQLFEEFIDRVLNKRHNLIQVLGIEKTLLEKKRKKRTATDLKGYERSKKIPIHEQVAEVIGCVLTYCEETLEDEVEGCEKYKDLMRQVGLFPKSMEYGFFAPSHWGKSLLTQETKEGATIFYVKNPERIKDIQTYLEKSRKKHEKVVEFKNELYQHCQTLKDFLEN